MNVLITSITHIDRNFDKSFYLLRHQYHATRVEIQLKYLTGKYVQ